MKYASLVPVILVCGLYSAANSTDVNSLSVTSSPESGSTLVSPSPDPCLSGAEWLKKLYRSVERCSTDNDCRYIDRDFESLDAQSLYFGRVIITDDCTIAPQPFVGNPETLKKKKESILYFLNETRTHCQERLFRENCTAIGMFEVNQGKPVCLQGSCQIQKNK